ncbi:outer membrane protein transport protein [Tamlana sp. 62-3]|uniref:Outer membrane protein transport protein n=1 Tax=Neotamlana sargassicola TaxID=2883125 RepID=A0A9X1I7J3_9FLAO|nr:outer membrane protein transport protein [Tamlana sargassicola]MCB4808229.1 outer membrane protein transport protein [Tamlana sargassicola]
MKKISLLAIAVLSMAFSYGQEITDALRYSQSEIQGSARFRALSGAFGALGGDLSAVSINPASSAVFNRSYVSFTVSNLDTKNTTNYFGNDVKTNNSTFDVNQGGAAFVFESRNNSPWKKLAFSIAYDKTNDFSNNWTAFGTNTNDDVFVDNGTNEVLSPANSIAGYFFLHADGLRLDEIKKFDDESFSEAYQYIGNNFGFANQQAFLGYESFIIEPEDITNDANTRYYSNVAPGNFMHDYSYFATGYNGKISFNFATQYEDDLYLGINLNSHFIDYERTTLLFENNFNTASTIDYIEFENSLRTQGNGFSFQVGGIYKLTPNLRIGATYDSPTWYTIDEETTQYIATDGSNGFIEIFPDVVNVYPRYKLKTPSKVSGSLAYVFGNRGLISFDYSNKDYGKMEFGPTEDAYYQQQNELIANTFTSASTYKLGGELKHKQFSFRGGYRFEESPYEDGETVGDLEGFSLGLGISFGNTKLDLTYDQAERSYLTPLYSTGLIDTASIDRKNSNLTLTLAFNL